VGVEEMATLMDYLEVFDIMDDRLSFDLSLARGLDYYTGLIFEVITEGSAPALTNGILSGILSGTVSGTASGTVSGTASGTATPRTLQRTATRKRLDADDDRSDDPTVGVGSVAAGGRYDNLVERFLPKAHMPCVGVSFGVDRIFSITKARMARDASLESLRASETDVYVMAFGGKGFDGMLHERMRVCRLLWDAEVRAEFSYKAKPKLMAQFKAAEQGDVPFAVILGEVEQARGEVKVKELGLPEGHPEKDGVVVKIEELAREVKRRLAVRARTTGELAKLDGAATGLSVANGTSDGGLI
jgi:histidyl-tRNA synthetase